ncbi:hypothetical protein GCK72_016821 [Caenorhabditis remanei]|uniref:7TM GPCR serpentine receptor class x (Srx) domain-containing protein n=1 Tax=Caenorhabditis remanei TaxID=31234 RepID=A0A6A5G6S7_CAERE|nr:hypothetical protein GCK72_016821 [Caenorhabditis remanei]KAF1750274.1 hypothetical protein GCK72_016821 [Caenorhabditis remanei]
MKPPHLEMRNLGVIFPAFTRVVHDDGVAETVDKDCGVEAEGDEELEFWAQLTSLGIVCNWLVVIAISGNRSLNHSFSLLTATQAAANGVFSVLYLGYVAPMMILDLKVLKDNSEHVGFLLIICYDISIQTHVLITVNRFCAVFLPVVYKNLFNPTETLSQTATDFTTSDDVGSKAKLKHARVPCRAYYNDDWLGFGYTDLEICADYNTFGDMGKLSSMCVFNVVVDTVTIWKVRRIRSAQGMKKFQKKEIDFLKQSFGQAIYLIICIPALYIIPMFTTSRISLFIMGSLFWPTIHTFDDVEEGKPRKTDFDKGLYKTCCEKNYYCEVWAQAWFWYTIGGVILLLILLSVAGCVYCCCCRGRGSGGADKETNSEEKVENHEDLSEVDSSESSCESD